MGNQVYRNEIVFSPKLKDAQERLFQMIYEEDYIKGEKIIKSRNNKGVIEYIETDKRTIEAVPTLLNQKMKRCSVAHVDKETSIYMMENLVFPCLVLYYKTDSIWDSIKFFQIRNYFDVDNPFFNLYGKED